MMNKLIIFVCLFSISIHASKSLNLSIQTKLIVNDTIKVNYKTALQKTANLFLQKKIFSFENEHPFGEDLLETKEHAEDFAKFFIFLRYPEAKKMTYEFEMSEDSSKKLWFVSMKIPETLDGNIFMIIIKNNCKILYFNNFCCPK